MSPRTGPMILTAAGILFMWSGLRGAKVSDSIRDLITGRAPSMLNANPITGAPITGIGGTSVTGGYTTPSAIANDFLQYVGKVPYKWGGANPNGWDCSGAVNYVLCHDLGIAIPGYSGGSFNGSSHGPVTGQWLIWSGAVNIDMSNAQAGDLVCWLTHIGVAIDSERYVSAIDTTDGTGVQYIRTGGPFGELAQIRRLKAAMPPGEAGIPHKG